MLYRILMLPVSQTSDGPWTMVQGALILINVLKEGLRKFIRAAEGHYFNTIDQIGKRSDSNEMGKLMGYGNWYWHILCNFTLIYSVSNWSYHYSRF